MTTQLLIDNRQGGIFEVPHGKVTYKTSRKGRAGSLEFDYIGGDVFTHKITINNGDVVLFKVNEVALFYGYVFKVSGQDEKKILAYDQLRYLKNKDSFGVANKTADEIVKLIANVNNIKLGKVASTGYVIPKTIADNKEYFDAIYGALEKTLLATGRTYFLQDNVGAMELLDIADTKLDLVIDGDTLLLDYESSKDIDSDTYNRVKLIQDGLEGEVVVEDKTTQARWGRLQYHDVLDKELNKAQVMEQAQALLKLKNREKKSLKLECLGDIRCKAGYSPYVSIPKENIEGYFLINSATHTFTDNEHTMSLEMVVI
ncbi:XkdQ/YqbQ family protein [Zhenhengia yiwuensis]|nr:hypothetical protein [Zhenhengia yiwuensis]MDY3367462.1 hypothetical protein [Zhenhengia yiwuensis]